MDQDGFYVTANRGGHSSQNLEAHHIKMEVSTLKRPIDVDATNERKNPKKDTIELFNIHVANINHLVQEYNDLLYWCKDNNLIGINKHKPKTKFEFSPPKDSKVLTYGQTLDFYTQMETKLIHLLKAYKDICTRNIPDNNQRITEDIKEKLDHTRATKREIETLRILELKLRLCISFNTRYTEIKESVVDKDMNLDSFKEILGISLKGLNEDNTLIFKKSGYEWSTDRSHGPAPV